MKRFIFIVLAVSLCLGAGAVAEGGLWSRLFGRRERVVGRDVALGDIADFYCTYATSTFEPEYQRYRFFAEDERYRFYHERREGDHFPLTEADVTVSGTVDLTAAQWAAFCDCVAGGTVRPRSESLDSGDSGPWYYLYWPGDGADGQPFSFASPANEAAFDALCDELRGEGTGIK